MTQVAYPPLFFEGKPEEHTRKIAHSVRELIDGKSNNARSITLRPNETTTFIENPRFCCDTVVSLTPKSASAAAAMASGSLYFESGHGRITIFHDSQPDTDRTFGAVLVG